MTAPTHYTFSVLLCFLAGVSAPAALASSVASLLPDLDHPDSFIGRVFRPLSVFLQRRYGHRTVTHSIFAIFGVAVLFLPLVVLSPVVYGAAVLAFGSHLFLDLFNVAGVRLFAPVSSKEYISFRTTALRIPVSSWKEYLLLIVLSVMVFHSAGKDFSVTSAARNLGKHIFKNYSNALLDYQENSSFICIAHVDYFDAIERRKLVEDLVVLNMYPESAVFLRNGDRLVLGKENINEITVDRTDKRVASRKIAGSDPALLSSIPDGSYISGSIVVKNYFPEIKSNSFITVDRRSDGATFTLKCAAPWELSRILNLHNEIGDEIEKLKKQLCSYQVEQLKAEEQLLKKRIEKLRKKSLYANYDIISKLSAEVKKIQAKISTLEMKESIGGDAEIQEKINLLSNGFHFWCELVVFKM